MYYRWREDVERGGWKRNEEVAERIAVHGGLNLEICVGPGAGFAPATLMKNYNSNIMISDLCPTVVKEWYKLFQNMENPPPNIEYAVFDVCDMPFVDTICSHYFGGVRMIKKRVLPLALIGLVIVFLVVLFIVNGGIVLDHSGERRGEQALYWNDTLYVPCSGEYSEGKTIAKTTDGWQINEVIEDDTHTFIVLRSFLDQYLLVKEDYKIPTSGAMTIAVWNGKNIYDENFHVTLSKILEQATTDFEYETDGIFQLTDNQKMYSLYVGYEGCPVATTPIGYMGQVNGTWCITTQISDDRYNADGSPKPYKVSCYSIPQEYIEVLEQYVS